MSIHDVAETSHPGIDLCQEDCPREDASNHATTPHTCDSGTQTDHFISEEGEEEGDRDWYEPSDLRDDLPHINANQLLPSLYIMARYVHPSVQDIQATAKHTALLARLRNLSGLLTPLMPFDLSRLQVQTSFSSEFSSNTCDSAWQVAVFSLVPYAIVESGNPLLVTVEIIAQNPRVRAIARQYRVPPPVEDRLGAEIRAALRWLPRG